MNPSQAGFEKPPWFIRQKSRIVMAGYAGLAGSAALVRSCTEKLAAHLPDWLLDDTLAAAQTFSLTAPVKLQEREKEELWYPIGRGGVEEGLWNLGELCGCGMRVELSALPIRQETVEICEVLDENPYRLEGSGFFIVTQSVDALLDRLRRQGITAADIGTMEKEKARLLLKGESAGYLNKPRYAGRHV